MMRANVAPEVAILQEAQAGRYDLIVMGVSRRPGEKLFFGNAARSVLERAKCSVMFLAGAQAAQQTDGKGDTRSSLTPKAGKITSTRAPPRNFLFPLCGLPTDQWQLPAYGFSPFRRGRLFRFLFSAF